ncbi:Gfo/Idh/MocA family oxidoreductase [Alteromonas sp. CYL-A6]|uniref:Gfo/Idh/MocA family oxidoreductase n=1 Tax=Alteromonas nitratireducens TaxID=3390813 RepID=UPI0034BA3DC8
MKNNSAASLSVLVVGFGFSANTFHLPFLRHFSDVDIAGVVSSRPEMVAQTLPDVPVWSSLDEALAARRFDAVVITTPNHLHANQAEQALLAGCHVLVEKPFTLTASEASRLVALAARRQRVMCVYQNRRFDGDFLTLRALINDKRVGEVRRLESRFDRFRPVPRDRWRENDGPGSGITWDLAPHLIDQALVLFGMPVAVTARIATLRDGGKSDDCFDIDLIYKEKLISLGSSPFQAGATLRYDLQGTAGSFRKFGLDPQENQLKQGVVFSDPDWAQTPGNEHGSFHGESTSETIITQRGGYLTFYRQFLDAISGRGLPPVSPEEAINVIRLTEIAFASSQQQNTLRL